MKDVRVAYTKWGGAAHWTYDALLLGEDEHGVWVGAPAPLIIRRPGAEFVFEHPCVQLFPRSAPWTLAAYSAAPQLRYELYIDITTEPVWSSDGSTVTMVDLDLDVVRLWDGTVEVLDEDEFAQHRHQLGYPGEIVELAERTCAERAAALAAGEEPFASAYHDWLARLP